MKYNLKMTYRFLETVQVYTLHTLSVLFVSDEIQFKNDIHVFGNCATVQMYCTY